MKPLFLTIAALSAAISAAASGSGSNVTLRFEELPFIEGTLYVSVSCGADEILRSAVEVESETVDLTADLSGCEGREIFVRAYQDLNGNRTLDFDSYGRPQEPVLQTSVTVVAEESPITLKLIRH